MRSPIPADVENTVENEKLAMQWLQGTPPVYQVEARQEAPKKKRKRKNKVTKKSTTKPVCVCGFIAKNKLGLSTHIRFCDAYKEQVKENK